MNKRDSFLRYTFIIKKLRNFKHASSEEINQYLYNEFGLQDEPLRISKRTLQRDLNEIRSLFGIDIRRSVADKKIKVFKPCHPPCRNSGLRSPHCHGWSEPIVCDN
jgi:hypothetical protein